MTPVDAPTSGGAVPPVSVLPRLRIGRLGSSSLATEGVLASCALSLAVEGAGELVCVGGFTGGVLPGAAVPPPVGFLSSGEGVLVGSAGFGVAGFDASERRSLGGPSSSSPIWGLFAALTGLGSEPVGRQFPAPNQLFEPVRMASA